jgi:hypothetical protein
VLPASRIVKSEAVEPEIFVLGTAIQQVIDAIDHWGAGRSVLPVITI